MSNWEAEFAKQFPFARYEDGVEPDFWHKLNPDEVIAFIRSVESAAVKRTQDEIAKEQDCCKDCDTDRRHCEWAKKYHKSIGCCPDCSHKALTPFQNEKDKEKA